MSRFNQLQAQRAETNFSFDVDIYINRNAEDYAEASGQRVEVVKDILRERVRTMMKDRTIPKNLDAAAAAAEGIVLDAATSLRFHEIAPRTSKTFFRKRPKNYQYRRS